MANHISANIQPSPQRRRRLSGLLNLAVELRLKIYAYVFAPAHERCTRQAILTTHGDEEEEHCCAAIHPQGINKCSSVSTNILRVNKQICREAMPVMYQNLEIKIRLSRWGHLTGAESVDDGPLLDPHLLSSIRRCAIATDLDTLGREVLLYGVPQTKVERWCRVLGSELPGLGELRLHVDVPVWWFEDIDLEEGAWFLGNSMQVVLRCFDGVVVFVDLHVRGGLVGDGGRGMQDAVVSGLRAKAWGEGKRVGVEGWE